MFEFYQLIPSIAFITGKDYCQTGTLEVSTRKSILCIIFKTLTLNESAR